MEEAAEVRADDSLFDAIQKIVARDSVLVRDSSRALTGIVTTADLSLQFKDLSEPFLLLGQIEDCVRNLDTKQARLVIASMHVEASQASWTPHAKLVFCKYADQYFLSQIWDGQSHIGTALSVPQQLVAVSCRPEAT
jgi:hypothetical protein